MSSVKLGIFLARLAVRLVALAVEAVVWGIAGAARLLGLAHDLPRLAAGRPGGVLRCPLSHEIPVEGVNECSACGYRYIGSVFCCPNPECPAPVATYTNCPTCGLSVRSPYRWG